MADDDGDGGMQDYRDEVNDMPEGNDGIDAMDEPDFGDEEDPNEEEEKERITTRTLTKYERARILGTRALQLSMGAPPMVEIQPGETDPLVIAKRELQEKKIPITIRRFLPDGSYEDWPLDDLTIPSMGQAP
ncbi:unnamed protein product [Chondrus crispus]|uniref:Uncharacterized protein n=1 Tax=Chondrus crispus TaxID=2769 RepID=R7QAB3_CHOCR|nr:unnamed protein product [Chondrus crispus]CDF34728.1 unnamed protein product [Chondrus crispus]|eukprot:XP_005714547.1 unnamed protein product [Chondrus crispus]